MSVNTSDEYLDELLQSIEPIIYMNEPIPDSEENTNSDIQQSEEVNGDTNLLNNMVEIVEPESVENGIVEPELVENGIVEPEPVENGIVELEPIKNETSETEPVENEIVETVPVEIGDSLSVDDLLAEMPDEEEKDATEADMDFIMQAAMNGDEAGDSDSSDYDSEMQNEDVKELLKQFADDDDLAGIGEILERNDNGEAVDDTMLQTPEVEVFQLDEEADADHPEESNEKKGIFGFFKKKKGKKNKGQNDDSGVIGEDELLSEENGSVLEEISSEENASDLASPLEEEQILYEGDMTDIDMLLSGALQDSEEIREIDNIADVSDEVKESSKKKSATKKESLFSKIFKMLTEEEEDSVKEKIPEAAATGVTDENLAILDELSKEDKKKAKKEKKEQKAKEKKEKKDKKKGKSAEDGEEGEESENDDKKGKKKKKVKKEKPRKVVDLDSKPEKKLSRKKVMITFALCFSILAMILILRNAVWNAANLKEARWAFDNADYQTCYANLYGEKLSDEDEILLEKSYIILCVQRKLDSFENFMRMDMKVEALNALLEGVRVYRDKEARASELGILQRISTDYQTIYEKLAGFGLDNEDIEEILNYDSKVTYTKRLESIVNGTPFEAETFSPEVEENTIEVSEPQPLLDVLPQEEDFLPEDTSQVNAMEQSEMIPSATDTEPQQGETVVVGSAPVDIDGLSREGGNADGVNVGNGNTDVSVPVDGDNVIVGGF